MITHKTVLSLIDVARKKEDYRRLQGYWNACRCLGKIYTSEGRLYGRYCKNRNCLLCLSIRKADIINRYLPVFKTWPNPHFVAITVKNALALTCQKQQRKAKPTW
jgi:hypothetical protein